MNGNAARFFRIAASSAGLLVLGCVLTTHAARPVSHGISLPSDWSHQHLIFSRPASVAVSRGVVDDPRYMQQAYRRTQSLRLPAELPATGMYSPNPLAVRRIPSWNNKKKGGLWAENLGTGANPGAGNYPAKFSFDTNTANCGNATTPDFVIYSTGLTGGVNQADIVAFDNLYTGCTGTVPSVYWAYNTSGLGSGAVLTSPVLSFDGSQIAFVQTNGAGAATLVLLKWAASTIETVALPGTPLSVIPSLYRACVAPCMTTFALVGTSGATDDTTSSVFYDYRTDVAWVGDSGGFLHQFTGVFKGPTPAEATSPWPVQVNPTTPTPVTSPVHDFSSGKIFIADQGGFLYSVNATTGAVVQSGQVDFGTGLVESPIVDSSNASVFVFSSSDGTANCTASVACSAVFLFNTGFSSGSTGSEVTVGDSVTIGSLTPPNPMYIGGFDGKYFNSGGIGNMYVCGNTGANPTLYQVPVSDGTFPQAAGNMISTLTPLGSTAACSPVTDVINPSAPNGAHEFVFVSSQNDGGPPSCGSTGCLISFLNSPWRASLNWPVGQQILSSNLDIETVIVTGRSGAVTPNWNTSPLAGDTITDNTVTWINQGPLSAVVPPQWANGHAYLLHNRIIDTNNNIEVATGAGTSGGTQPTWPLASGATTNDGGVGGVTWTNAGSLPIFALSVAGGTSGVIIDNTTNTVTGASQVYFGTLADQTCGTSGTGGCAMQASQVALQ